MKYLINSNRNGSLNFFEFKTITNNFEKPVITINCHDGPVTNFLTGISGEDIDRGPLLPNENLILTAGKFDGIVRLFDLRLKSKGVGRMVPKDIIKDSSNISKFKGVTNVATVGVNDSTTTSNFGMTVGEEGKVFLMDLRNQSGVLKSYTIQSSGERCFPMQTNPVDRCCYSLKSVNNGLVSGWGNGKIYVNHIIKKEDMEIKIKDQQLTRDLLKEENYSEFKEFSGMKNAIRNISLSPNNNQVICSGDDGVIVKFNLEFSQ
ncbi:hypothetical protein HK099_004691 [Clydaea vesicula]|uniref:Uncharacterized protein n=1 Tax=Clydaea vesicula TaxID=447962 RepID=A0AAD5Y2Y4_9FUNG|nr:hypothetical protein HK099_004691 [Clydaea vesicula]